jgi:hypothetical protein
MLMDSDSGVAFDMARLRASGLFRDHAGLERAEIIYEDEIYYILANRTDYYLIQVSPTGYQILATFGSMRRLGPAELAQAFASYMV